MYLKGKRKSLNAVLYVCGQCSSQKSMGHYMKISVLDVGCLPLSCCPKVFQDNIFAIDGGHKFIDTRAEVENLVVFDITME